MRPAYGAQPVAAQTRALLLHRFGQQLAEPNHPGRVEDQLLGLRRRIERLDVVHVAVAVAQLPDHRHRVDAVDVLVVGRPLLADDPAQLRHLQVLTQLLGDLAQPLRGALAERRPRHVVLAEVVDDGPQPDPVAAPLQVLHRVLHERENQGLRSRRR